ncbi:Mis12 protein-domain-containing protein [Globomyces pollinis-pini]|nr:Mis12 protein-domain-containing protein [Globomyces pollinis-pini]
MNPDTVIEHLGFAPMQFIDQTIDITNKSLYKSMRYFETLIQDEMGVQQTEEGMQAIETLFEQAIDSKLDRFEVYCLKNIFSLPPNKTVILPHYQGLNFNLSNQEQKQLNEGLDDLRLKMLIERYKKSKMLSIKEQLDKKIEQIQTVQKNLVRLENTAKENEIDPLKDSLISCKNELDEIQDKMEMIHKRTGSVDWGTVPVVGKAPHDSNRLKAVQTEIVGHLKKQSSLLNGQSPNISAWDVTREFRDALAIGSVKHLETIRKQMV